MYRTHDLTAPGRNPNRMFEWQGTVPYQNWAYSREELDRMLDRGEILLREDGTVSASQGHKIYLDEQPGAKLQTIWNDIPKVGTSAERTGYPTQKPLKLLKRIIESSSNEGDMVLDPFCGCATACVAAEQLHRQWIGIDISPSAEDITKIRLQDEVDENADLFNPFTDVIVQCDPPERTDDTETARQLNLPRAETFKPELFGRQEGRCNGGQYPFYYRNLTIDHIIPRADTDGIPDDRIENLQLLCGACNSTKGDRTQEYLINKLREDGILRS